MYIKLITPIITKNEKIILYVVFNNVYKIHDI